MENVESYESSSRDAIVCLQLDFLYGGGLSEVQWGAIMQYSGGCKYGGGLSCSTVGGGLS